MTVRLRSPLIAGALVLLAACSGPTGTSASEDRALDEAAASLDANTSDSNAAQIVDQDGSNEEQPQ